MRGVVSKLKARDEMPRPPSGGISKKGRVHFELQAYQNHAIVDCHRWPHLRLDSKSAEVKWGVSAEGGWTEIALDVKNVASKISLDSNPSGAFRVGSILQRYPCHSMAVNCGQQDDP
jgi:hypothetical protein